MKFIENDRGFTYTLEAMIGIVLIISMVLFFTNNMPYMAQKTGEHSKVQLMNMGRDALDLLEVTPVSDIFEDYWVGQVYRNYTLVADKTFVEPGENITFTVYKLGLEGPEYILYQNLSLSSTILGLDGEKDHWTINGTLTTNFSESSEFNVRAYVGDYDDPINWSNYVTINVGYYYLDTDISGISDAGDKNVSGVVYNSKGEGVPNLDIEILKYDKITVLNSSADITSNGRVIEDFDSLNGWSPLNNLTLNDTSKKEGISSISINGTSNIWIQKTNTSVYGFDYYDIVSFYFFSINANETIDVELSNTSNNITVSGKFIWKDINPMNFGWNKINVILKYPDEVEGNIKVENIDRIRITVSNITDSADYLFDYLIAGEGRFSFEWSIDEPGADKGSYYIRANDSFGNTSNEHRIIYSETALIVSSKYVIYEGDTVLITLIPAQGFNKFPNNNDFNINQIKYTQYDQNKIFISDPFNDGMNVYLTANTSGDYYIFYGTTSFNPTQDPAKAVFTNTILIKVLPIDRPCNVGECFVCGGINLDELNEYMRRYLPPYVNFNLYLINPDGSLCYDCPEFKEIINGYPTSEAVTVNKILHVNQQRNLGFMREIRIVLWYK